MFEHVTRGLSLYITTWSHRTNSLYDRLEVVIDALYYFQTVPIFMILLAKQR